MARNKFIFSTIFFALIIFGQQIQPTEGRYLKNNEGHQNLVKHNGGNSATNAATFRNVSSQTLVDASGAAPPPNHGVDDFRPTIPGHSPGVGHSIHA
ncbi:hypothetical protein RJT34_30700 [Clitoria ternatea]|uniref:Encoded peptide n=1 Tax=Clitoria ternatea TaxID=43366 RepID=A0AAN9EXH6_CLITE